MVDINNVLKDAYSYFTQETNNNGLPTQINYYRADAPFKYSLSFVSDDNGSLAGTYLTFVSAITKFKLTIWYEVDGNGTAPSIDGVVEKIAIGNDEFAAVIAQLTRIKLKEYSKYFTKINVKQLTKLEILVSEFGEHSELDITNTPFTLTTLEPGKSSLVGSVALGYDSNNNPIYNGNTLKGLRFNPYTASFDVEVNDNVAIGTTPKVLIDTVGTITYVGEAAPGSELTSSTWRIQRISKTGSVTSIEHPNGNASNEFSWNLRATYVYS